MIGNLERAVTRVPSVSTYPAVRSTAAEPARPSLNGTPSRTVTRPWSSWSARRRLHQSFLQRACRLLARHPDCGADNRTRLPPLSCELLAAGQYRASPPCSRRTTLSRRPRSRATVAVGSVSGPRGALCRAVPTAARGGVVFWGLSAQRGGESKGAPPSEVKRQRRRPCSTVSTRPELVEGRT